MALEVAYPSATVAWDCYVYSDTNEPMELDLGASFTVLVDGQGNAVATVAGGGTAAGIEEYGAPGTYVVQSWPLGGTAGTGALRADWYGVGTDGGTLPAFHEHIYDIRLAPSNGYCNLSDLPKYGLAGATNYYDSDDEGNAFIEQGWNWLNGQLEAILPDVRVPVATTSTGEYDQHLIAANAWMANYYLTSSRHRGETSALPEWILDFRYSAEAVITSIGSKNVVLEEQTSIVESGIGPVTAGTTNTGAARMHSDRFGYKGIYLGYDYERTYYVRIDAAAGDKDIDDCTFEWSMDGGVTMQATGIACSTDWTLLANNAHIRFERVGGTTDQLQLGDFWYFKCVPVEKRTAGGPQAARSVKGRRSG